MTKFTFSLKTANRRTVNSYRTGILVLTLTIAIVFGLGCKAANADDLLAKLARMDDQNLTHQLLETLEGLTDEQRNSATRYYRYLALEKFERLDEANALAFGVTEQSDPHDLYDHLLLGTWFRNQGLNPIAFEHLAKAFELAPEHTDVRLLELRLWFDQIMMTQNRDQWIMYVDTGLLYIQKDPIIKREWIKNLSGMQPEKQARLLEEFCQENPEDGTAHKYLGNTYVQLADGERALPPLDRAVELLPQQGNVHVVRANALTWLERYDEAAEAHDKAIELEPTSTSYHARGLFHLVRGNGQEAVDDFLKAQMQNPRGWFIFESSVDAMSRAGLHQELDSWLQKVAEGIPTMAPECDQKRASNQLLMGQTAAAIEIIEAAIADCPGPEETLHRLRLQRACYLAADKQLDAATAELDALQEVTAGNEAMQGLISETREQIASVQAHDDELEPAK